MVPVIFINSSSAPYVDLILAGLKTFETRSRDTLGCLKGQRVLIAESGKRRPPIIRASAFIGTKSVRIENAEDWGWFRASHQVPYGTEYDWKPDTKVKYMYQLIDVRPCVPFVPELGKRHGRVWAELDEKNIPLDLKTA